MNEKVKKTAMPLFLALLMGLSVVGFSYSPDQNPTSSSAPGSTVTYQDITFTYVPETQQYQANIQGSQVRFYSSPGAIERFDYPDVNFNTVEELRVVTPPTSTEQQGFIAEQMQQDLSQRLLVPVTTGQGVCDNESIITITITGNQSFQNTDQNCYETSLTDQSVLTVQDHIVLSQYDLI